MEDTRSYFDVCRRLQVERHWFDGSRGPELGHVMCSLPGCWLVESDDDLFVSRRRDDDGWKYRGKSRGKQFYFLTSHRRWLRSFWFHGTETDGHCRLVEECAWNHSPASRMFS